MSERLKITNERDLKRARQRLKVLREFSSSSTVFDLLQGGLAPEIIEAQQHSAQSLASEIENSINRYESLKGEENSTFDNLRLKDFQKLPIFARLMHGSSQEDFAVLLGIKQQQLQKYEAEDFSSMKVSSFIALLNAVGVKLDKISIVKAAIQPESLKVNIPSKILQHALKERWVKSDEPASQQDVEGYIQSIFSSYVKSSDGIARFRGTPTADDTKPNDGNLIWLSRVAELANLGQKQAKIEFDPLKISYLKDLLALSMLEDGPKRAIDFLLQLGIAVVVEPNLPGLCIDGAAFSVRSQPIIGLTLRYDRIDNFWFTLLHELGHVHLHQAKGLNRGFIDNFDSMPDNEIEQEADRFALETVMPIEKWRLSPARLANKPEPVIRLAKILGVNKAILFGRIRKERGYNLFSDQIGQGQVRKLFNQLER